MYSQCTQHLETDSKLSQYELNLNDTVLNVKFRKCVNCSYRSTSTLLFLKHTCISFKCEYCPRILATLFSLRQHNARKHSDDATKYPKWYNCERCSYQTLDVSFFWHHMARKHAVKENMEPLKRDNNKYKVPIENEIAQCAVCSESMHKNSLLHHVLTEHSRKSSTYECGQCDRRYRLRQALKRHILRHHIAAEYKQWYQCNLCPLKTTNSSALKNHMIRMHTTEENINWFLCSFCDYRTKISTDLLKHTRNMHDVNGKKKKQNVIYDCEFCHATFKKKGAFRTHILRNHIPDEHGELHRCQFCDYAHVHKSDLNRHMTTKHLEQQIKCPYCQVICKNKLSLSNHIRRKKHIINNDEPINMCE